MTPSRVKPRAQEFYGWKKQLPDVRDVYWVHSHLRRAGDLPPRVDLTETKFMPEVFAQGRLGSCTANAIASAVMFDQCRQGIECFTPSRLMIYYEERRIEGTIYSDSGAVIRDGFKVIAETGVAPETLWPYNIDNFAQQPPLEAYEAAKLHHAIEYLAVPQTLEDIKGVVAEGLPIVFGFGVYRYFESEEMARGGVLHLPEAGEPLLGGHAVKIVGYDDLAVYNPLLPPGYVKVKNSWNSQWGLGGYFYMPYSFLLNPALCSDFWVVRSLS